MWGDLEERENVVATMVDATVVGSGAQVHPGQQGNAISCDLSTSSEDPPLRPWRAKLAYAMNHPEEMIRAYRQAPTSVKPASCVHSRTTRHRESVRELALHVIPPIFRIDVYFYRSFIFIVTSFFFFCARSSYRSTRNKEYYFLLYSCVAIFGV